MEYIIKNEFELIIIGTWTFCPIAMLCMYADIDRYIYVGVITRNIAINDIVRGKLKLII